MAGRARRPGRGAGARSSRRTSRDAVPRGRARLHRRRPGRPMRVVLDGGNGMAGPMVGPLLESLPLDRDRDLLGAGRRVPRPRAQPAARGEPAVHHRPRARDAAPTSGIAWDGDADRCFFIDDTGEFVAGDFLTALLAESLLRKEPGATVLYDVRASRAVRDVVERGGGTRRGQPRRPRLLQDAHARRPAPRSAARCPATTTSATSTAPTPARSRRC